MRRGDEKRRVTFLNGRRRRGEETRVHPLSASPARGKDTAGNSIARFKPGALLV